MGSCARAFFRDQTATNGSQTHRNDTESFPSTELGSARAQFDEFHVVDLAGLHGEPQQRAHLVKPVHARSPWIDVQPAPSRIALHPQQVAVAANEGLGALALKQVAHSTGVAIGATADVAHQEPHPAAFPAPFFWKFRTNPVVVDVPEHRTDRSHFCQGVRHVERPNVARMPNLIDPAEVMEDAVVAVAVGVGKQADAHGGGLGMQVAAFLAQIAAMLKPLLTAILAATCAVHSFAQLTLSTDDKRAGKAYNEGLEHYLHGRVDDALEALEAALKRDATFFEAHMLKGQILDESGFPSASATAYLAGYAFHPARFPKGRLRLCQLLHRSGRYDEGLEALATAQELPGWESTPEWEAIAAHLQFAAQAITRPVELISRPLEGDVNTPAPEYYPAMTADGQTLLFTRQIGGRNAFEGQEDFYTATRIGPTTWGNVQPLRGINTPDNEGAPTLQGDGQRLVFTACSTLENGYGPRTGKGSCDLFEAEWNDRNAAFDLGYNLGAPNTSAWESQPSLSADGTTLLFVRSTRATRDRPAQQDIYEAHRLADGSWSEATPVAGPINTPGIDGNPVLHPDGSTLYFVSDGHPGMGGLDLFRSERQPDGSWGVPVNLGYPINTHHDESSVLVTPDGRWAFFATDREEPGNLDLWELRLPDELVAKEVRVLRGRVYDVTSGQPVTATVDVIRPDGQAIARVQSAGGGFELPMPEGDALRFRVDHPHYAFYSELVSWDEVDADRPVEIGLTRFEVGTVLTLKDVRFASGSAVLEAVFQPELEQLAALLLANEERVQIIGHTDNRGTPTTNQALSEARAEAVRAYLADKGVPADRMLTEGRGDSDPIATNETEAGRAINRRTEIVVIE